MHWLGHLMINLVIGVMFFLLGWSLQPYMNNTDEFLVELMDCQMETRESCAFVAMPETAYMEIQLLYSQHVK